jgi:tyramine---L-glutamate ligase
VDGTFKYLGGLLPLSDRLAARASSLAAKAVSTLSDSLGYLGVDMVLGDCPDGSTDYVIEINPRLTTSYVGLRSACKGNIAEAMLAVAQGIQTPSLAFDVNPRRFFTDGRIKILAQDGHNEPTCA